MKKIPYFVTTFVFLFLLFGMGLWTLLSPDPSFVASERRSAAPMPSINTESFLDGKLGKDVESYLLDSLPPREALRRLQNRFSQNVMGLYDKDGIFLSPYGLAKDLSPVNETLITRTAATFDRLMTTYFPESHRVFLSVIPDKAYFVRKNGERLDTDALFTLLSSSIKTPHTDVDLAEVLSASAYYATDIHWREEALFPVAERLSEVMGFTPPQEESYTAEVLGEFVGTLGLQGALSKDKDTLRLLYDKNGVIENASVTYPDGKLGSLYEKNLFSQNLDPYDVFLRGEQVSGKGNFYIKIENQSAEAHRRLIIFRDSFARSLVPLLLEGYSEIILFDLRAVTAFYGEYADWLYDDGKTDILFLASVYTLNTTEIR